MDNNNNHESREHYRKRMEERIQRDVNERKKRERKEQSENRMRREAQQSSPDFQPPQKHHYRTPNWVRILIGLLICLVVAGGFYEYHKVHSVAKGVFGAGDGKISKKLQKGEPVSVLTMGTDVGALNRGNTGGNTDSLELFTINPKKKTITMTSIPRDILVRVETKDGPDYVKLNAAYAINGPKQTVKQVSELLDVPIDYYAVINMGVLKKVVNSVGGVEVDNPFAFDYEGHHFKKGKQHLNGDNALKYSRMRYDDPNNDYGRQKRQQQILKSVINKFKTSGSIGAANKILDAVGDGVKTNIPIDDIATLYGNYHGAMNNVKTYHFQGQNATIEGVSFQIASPKEINRVSKLVRAQLGLKAKNVVNHETKMYKSQPHYNGYNETDFILPGGASYNDPGSGNGSDEVTSSHSHHSSNSSEETNEYSNTTSESTEAYSESRAIPATETQTPVRHYSTPQYHNYRSYNNGYHSTYTHPTYGNHYGYTHRYY
ncbi:LCP family protein [Limosilactobacillus sp. STM2_1]|uniref:LCP family protein n=1 Tax=Limosilactobacillus rudii TaxID=2759755 RepID=A0A7W3ULR2_9LACO|nr:LCP family protein [Limosilactobacillus rudii]MBB1079824.1 LCP family protein [Limosilactobacillus rudii]MBB1097902.1 LCP family protein [Limosilactobacillus rudii]MCD7134814.1 LCP family protein [Limosilactobacillus rudii]